MQVFSSHINFFVLLVQVFDKLCPRLSDSNSKVNLYALQTLNRCIPIIRNGMAPTTTLIVENLKTPLSSKNEAIYLAARDCLITLTKYIGMNINYRFWFFFSGYLKCYTPQLYLLGVVASVIPLVKSIGKLLPAVIAHVPCSCSFSPKPSS